MKKIISIIAGLAALLAVSCSREQNVAGNKVTVSFVAEAPAGITTKAYSDGYTATTLYYAVYAEDKQDVVEQGEATFIDLKTTVDLTLVIGKTYDIIFWAQNQTAPYNFDMSTQTVTANYTDVDANDEVLDAFYKTVDSYKVEGPAAEKITLTRPFAQINVGISDEAIAAQSFITVEQSSMAVAGICNKLNLKDGSVSGEEAEVTFELAPIPSGVNDKITIAEKVYDYMEMNYVLVPADKKLTNVKFTLQTNEHAIDYALTNVPLQRNYRTNIYGDLLTDPTAWNIEIGPAYNEPDYLEPIL